MQAAGTAFSESSAHASLDDIAVRAGVGDATLYRHFPTRDSLLGAALRQRPSDLDVIATKFMKSDGPGETLQEWFGCGSPGVTQPARCMACDSIV